jgi:hypothetical protein
MATSGVGRRPLRGCPSAPTSAVVELPPAACALFPEDQSRNDDRDSSADGMAGPSRVGSSMNLIWTAISCTSAMSRRRAPFVCSAARYTRRETSAMPFSRRAGAGRTIESPTRGQVGKGRAGDVAWSRVRPTGDCVEAAPCVARPLHPIVGFESGVWHLRADVRVTGLGDGRADEQTCSDEADHWA